jgi:hypothetical protein
MLERLLERWLIRHPPAEFRDDPAFAYTMRLRELEQPWPKASASRRQRGLFNASLAMIILMPVAALVFLVEAIVTGHWYLVPLVGLCGLGTPRFPSWTLLLAAALYWVLGLHAAAVVLALNFPFDLAVARSEQGLGRETLRLDAPAHDARRPAAPAPAVLATSDVEAALRDVLGVVGLLSRRSRRRRRDCGGYRATG